MKTDTEQLVDSSTIIFVGAVDSLVASNVPEVSRGNETITVRVEKVLDAAKELGELGGATLTIRISGDQPKPGDRFVFLTNPWVYGARLAVVEEDRLPPGKEADVVHAIETRIDRQVAERVASAVSIVVGKVERIEDAGIQQPVSFHSPRWARAIIKPEAVKKGTVGDRVSVLFATSRDVAWYQSPRLQQGQEAVFLLHQHEAPFAPADAYTVTDPLDVQPGDALGRISKWIESKP